MLLPAIILFRICYQNNKFTGHWFKFKNILAHQNFNSSLKLATTIQQDNGSHRLGSAEAVVLLHLNVMDNFVITSWEDVNKLQITVTRSINFIIVSWSLIKFLFTVWDCKQIPNIYKHLFSCRIYHKRVLTFSYIPAFSLLLSLCTIFQTFIQDVVGFNNVTVLLKRPFRIFNLKLQQINTVKRTCICRWEFTEIKSTKSCIYWHFEPISILLSADIFNVTGKWYYLRGICSISHGLTSFLLQ
jgi:hypothetical protein